jgi:peptidylprolyl isomerase
VVFAAAMTNRLLASSLIAAVSLVACSKEEAKPAAPAAPAPAAAAAPAPAAPPPVPPPPAEDLKGAPATATKLPSGVAFVVQKPGTGTEHAGDYDNATVNFSLWISSGQLIDSSLKTHQPAVFPILKIPAGWKQAVQQLVVGEKARFWIPEELAFKGRPGPQGMNILDIELLDIKKGTPPDPVPTDVAAAPADAVKLPDGLAIKTLKAGDGTTHPKLTDKISVKYTGWTTDGKMFDSSMGSPVTFPLGNLIAGWQEGIQKLSVGERARMWIPGKMAYEGRNGPQGTLVFDIELVAIGDPAAAHPAAPPAAPKP